MAETTQFVDVGGGAGTKDIAAADQLNLIADVGKFSVENIGQGGNQYIYYRLSEAELDADSTPSLASLTDSEEGHALGPTRSNGEDRATIVTIDASSHLYFYGPVRTRLAVTKTE